MKAIPLLALLFAGTSARADDRAAGAAVRRVALWATAERAFLRAHYQRARELYQRLADRGERDALLRLGSLYRVGEGVAEDYATARHYYERALAAGETNAHWPLGELYAEGGPGLAQSYTAARAHYEQLAAAGNGEGYRLIGDLYRTGGPGLAQNYATAKSYYERALAAGIAAHWHIGNLYRDGGPGLERDYGRARDWYERALAAGDRSGHLLLGDLYERGGPGLDRNGAEACRHYRQFQWTAGIQRTCRFDSPLPELNMNPSCFSPLLLLAGAPAWLYSHPASAEAATRWATAERQRQAQNWPAARAGYE